MDRLPIGELVCCLCQVDPLQLRSDLADVSWQCDYIDVVSVVHLNETCQDLLHVLALHYTDILELIDVVLIGEALSHVHRLSVVAHLVGHHDLSYSDGTSDVKKSQTIITVTFS